MLTEIEAAIPPMIAELDYVGPSDISSEMERAIQAICALESGAGPGSGAITSFLFRIEAIASSKIESVEASSEDFARALAGSKANESAALMVAASRAVTRMIDRACATGRITLEAILTAHKDLLADEPDDGPYSGDLRSVQNWIGASDHSPLRATFVPPTPQRVPELMDDLIRFMNRDDLPAIAQATIAHAQFESIHPFTDGNGCVGRALIGAIIRRRGTVSFAPWRWQLESRAKSHWYRWRTSATFRSIGSSDSDREGEAPPGPFWISSSITPS
ncbi:Fic family protein [Diaminobutyricibacter sp. McL0608]|uniref:Fic family protein n=1 Tax=Leifsonia sp. McL0608 TaxID=3143537 RepID=UPI0031F2D6F4